MIFNPVLDIIWAIVNPILSLIPDVELNTPDGVWDTGLEWIRAALWFFPFNTVMDILSLVLLLWVFRVSVAVLHSIWSSLPIV